LLGWGLRAKRRWIVRLNDPESASAFYVFTAARSKRQALAFVRGTVAGIERMGVGKDLVAEALPGPPRDVDLGARRGQTGHEFVGCRFRHAAPNPEPLSLGNLPDDDDLRHIQRWRSDRGFMP
jgi:hypothetical protein